jgi:amino acid transporter
MALGLLLTGIGGAFLPWIWRESVALQLTGPGLAEFVKFLPEVRTQQIDIERLSFLLPLFVSMLALPIVVENKKLDLPTWLRWALRLAVIPLALASISPVWAPQTLIDHEFRLQTLLAGLAIGLAVIASLLKNLPLKLLAVLLLVSGLTAIVLPMWQFSLIRPSIVETYQEPVSLNWGWWLTVGGIVSGIVGGIYAAFHETATNGK